MKPARLTCLLLLLVAVLPLKAQDIDPEVLSACPNVTDIFEHPRRTLGFYGPHYTPRWYRIMFDPAWHLYNPIRGASNDEERILLITDTSYYDPAANFPTIPPGETASLRLGHLVPDGRSHQIIFFYHVDTLVSDMILLKYAAVLQTPNHDTVDRPYFTFDILDSTEHTIDSTCYSANFIGDTSIGWQQYNNRGGGIWKPWTTVGVRLTNLHDQTILIRLTAADCRQGGHYGYAYFTLGCTQFEVQQDYCGLSDTFAFHAPEGFNYTWYSPSNPDSILSTTRDLYTTTPGTYTCRIHFIGAPIGSDCYTEKNCYTDERYPEAHFSFDTVDTVGCAIRYHFYNQSHAYIVENGDTIHTTQHCKARWVVDSTDTIVADSPYITLDSGLHRITFLAVLGQDDCIDSLSQQIFVGNFCHCHDTIYDTIVQNDLPWLTLRHTFYHETDTVIFHQGSHEWVNGVVGCDSIYDYHLRIWWNLYDTTHYDICPDDLPLTFGNIQLYDEGCAPVDTLLASHSEDSIMVACLHFLPTSDTTIYDTVIDTHLPHAFLDSLFTDSVTDCIFHLRNQAGCDSAIHYNLHIIYHRCDTTIYDTIVDTQLPWSFLDSLFTDTVTDRIFHIYSETGCDSTIHYNLYIFWNGDHCDTSLSFPNVVTPNGDGINDRFVIGGLLENACFKYSELSIYNRHGRLVYHIRNIHDENDWWTPNKHTPADTYFYYFKAHGVNIWTQHRGVIVLLRNK